MGLDDMVENSKNTYDLPGAWKLNVTKWLFEGKALSEACLTTSKRPHELAKSKPEPPYFGLFSKHRLCHCTICAILVFCEQSWEVMLMRPKGKIPFPLSRWGGLSNHNLSRFEPNPEIRICRQNSRNNHTAEDH